MSAHPAQVQVDPDQAVAGHKVPEASKSWSDDVWLGMRIGVLLLAVVLAALGVVWGTEHEFRPQEKQAVFYWILGTLLAIGLVLFTTARMGPKVATKKAIQEPDLPITKPHDKWFELLKLEYEKGADRYENIYRAVWQNFSYSVAVGAAILTFAATKLRMDFLAFVALSPVVFWFVATFIPMNRYGELTRARLRSIERDLNLIFFSSKEAQANHLGFSHFTKFASARSLWRVGDVVHFTGALVGLFWIWLLAGVLTLRDEKHPLILPPQPQATIVVAPPSAPASTQLLQPTQSDSIHSDRRKAEHGSRR